MINYNFDINFNIVDFKPTNKLVIDYYKKIGYIVYKCNVNEYRAISNEKYWKYEKISEETQLIIENIKNNLSETIFN